MSATPRPPRDPFGDAFDREIEAEVDRVLSIGAEGRRSMAVNALGAGVGVGRHGRTLAVVFTVAAVGLGMVFVGAAALADLVRTACDAVGLGGACGHGP